MAYCITHQLNNVAWASESFGCVMATCPPPEDYPLKMYFDLPSPEELEQMDANSEELRMDFMENR